MMASRSQNIPIAPSRYHLDELRCIQEERAAMIQADYDDYLFYRRIVGGIAKTQESTQCNKLKDLNQELIDHLHYIRHAPYVSGTSPPSHLDDSFEKSQPRRWNLLPKDSVPYEILLNGADDCSTTSTPSRTNSFASEDDDETLMFQLDL